MQLERNKQITTNIKLKTRSTDIGSRVLAVTDENQCIANYNLKYVQARVFINTHPANLVYRRIKRSEKIIFLDLFDQKLAHPFIENVMKNKSREVPS